MYLLVDRQLRPEIIRLYKAGWSSPRISRELNVNGSSVLRVVRQAGIVRTLSEAAKSPHSPQQRFWSKVEKTKTCWLWMGGVNPWGYGNFTISSAGQSINNSAHRYAYELIKGPIPPGLELDHLCRVRHCVNPEHLEPVTPAENQRRGAGFVADNAKKTHCVNGHLLSGENLILKPGKSWRICLTCARSHARRHQREKRARERARRPADHRRHNGNSIKTHCKRGHLFDSANTLTYRGMRFCRACRRLRGKGELK